MTNIAQLSDTELDDFIVTWAGRVAAGEARLLAGIAEFDRREAWAGPGLLSCAHWLSWRIGLGLTAARERVRVARSLDHLPLAAKEFGAGRLSWSQVRALTRVATPEDEQTWVDLARHATAAQLERLVRGVRRARRVVEDEADPELAAHRMRATTSYDADGTFVLTVRVPAADAAVLQAALEGARAELDRARREPGPADAASPARPATRTTLSAAVLHLARCSLDRQAAQWPELARRHRSKLVCLVDPLSRWARLPDGELLPPGPLTSTQDDLGRSARVPSLALRERLGTLDGERCRFPGCTRRRLLHAHHVTYWSDGGGTDLANLVLLCSRHHTLVHQQGFQLVLRPDRRLTVRTTHGQPLPHHPTLPWRPAEELDPAAVVGATTLPPGVSGDRLDLRYAVAVLMQQAA